MSRGAAVSRAQRLCAVLVLHVRGEQGGRDPTRAATAEARRRRQEYNPRMCAGETREAAFWESLHATTTRGTGPTFTVMSDSAIKAALYGDAGNTATTPDDGSQAQRQADMRLSSRLVDTYDFLAEVDQEGGNHMLPFLDEVDPSVSSSSTLLRPTLLQLTLLRWFSAHPRSTTSPSRVQ